MTYTTDCSDAGTFSAHDDALYEALLIDDRFYFRAAAHSVMVSGWRVLVPLSELGQSSVCVVEPPKGARQCPASVLNVCRQNSFEAVRFYLPGPPSAHEEWSPAFARSEEIAMGKAFVPTDISELGSDVTITAITPQDDAIKVALFASDTKRPDGRASTAKDYVAKERAKIEAGYMQGYLMAFRGLPAGCFSVSLAQPGLVRLKNLYVAQTFRGRGLGSAATAFAVQLGRRLRRPTVGAFSIKQGNTRSLYDKNGFSPVGSQTEMFAPLSRLVTGEV